MQERLQIVKEIAQIFFWFSVGISALLSYLQARKTLFQPKETEIFKGQFRQLDETIKFLSLIKGTGGKSQLEIELENFRKINYWMMMDYL